MTDRLTDEPKLEKLTCPTCGWEHRAPFGPHVPSTPWSDDCACSDLVTCLRHQIDGRTIPDRPDGGMMLARAQKRYDEQLLAWRERTAPLRTRPAEPQGLTAEEREALKWLRTWSGPRLDISASGHNDCDCDHCENARRAIATLDRLLSCSEVRR